MRSSEVKLEQDRRPGPVVSLICLSVVVSVLFGLCDSGCKARVVLVRGERETHIGTHL